jgi:hypothetical protein
MIFRGPSLESFWLKQDASAFEHAPEYASTLSLD